MVSFTHILIKFENYNLKPTNTQFPLTQDCVHSGDCLFYRVRDHNLCRKSPRRVGRIDVTRTTLGVYLPILYDKYYTEKLLNIYILVIRWIVTARGGYKRQRKSEKVNGNPRLYILYIIPPTCAPRRLHFSS